MTHPAHRRVHQKRDESWQLRLADRITDFAGSMTFVWVHLGLFVTWIIVGTLTGFDGYPFQFLTFVVSLEAIYLSTFVLIGQNRQSAFQQAKADHDYANQERMLRQNTDLTAAIHTLTTEIHHNVVKPARPRKGTK